MIPVYLCEDDENILMHVSKEIENHILMQNYDMEIVCKTGDPKQLLAQSRKNETSGVYFLDVDLKIPGFTGFELAKAIRERDVRGAIIFVTSHGELSMQTFRYRLEAMDYILKEDMEVLGRRIRECLDNVQQRLLRKGAEQSEYYTVKVSDTIYNVPVSKIVLFETSAKKHRIRLCAQNEVIEFFGNLQLVEEELGGGFFRCHRSTLINREHVRAIHLSKNEVELTDGRRYPLSRKAKKSLQAE